MKDRYCLTCFNKIKEDSILTLLLNSLICDECLEKRKLKLEKEKIKDMTVFYLSYHDGVMSQWLYQYKNSLDYELRKAFLTPFEDIIKLILKPYTIIPLPSSNEKIQVRGFDHLKEILKACKIPYLDLLGKTDGLDQKELSLQEREKIKERIYLKQKVDLSRKRIILFDDVLTSGSTMTACKEIIKELKPKSIKGFVLMRQHY